MPTENEYTLQDLADLAAVTPRTIRYYIAQGLLPSPGRPGPGAAYAEGHLARLRLIRQLQREHLPLAEIRARLAGLDDETVAELVEETGAPGPEPDTAADYIRRVLGGATAASPEAPATPAASAPLTPSAPAPLLRRSIGLPTFGEAAFVALKAATPPSAPSAPPPASAPSARVRGQAHLRAPIPRSLAVGPDRPGPRRRAPRPAPSHAATSTSGSIA